MQDESGRRDVGDGRPVLVGYYGSPGAVWALIWAVAEARLGVPAAGGLPRLALALPVPAAVVQSPARADMWEIAAAVVPTACGVRKPWGSGCVAGS